MKIAVDFDGTLANTHKVVLDLINFKRGTKYVHEDVTSWNWWKEVGIEDDFWAIYDMFDRTYLRRAIPPMSPLACATVKWLQKRGHECEIVTSNHEESIPSIRSWMFGHGLDFPVHSIGRISPAEKVHLNYELFIDDAPQLIEAMKDVPEKSLVLVDQPWNRNIALPMNVHPLGDWEEAIYLFEELGL